MNPRKSLAANLYKSLLRYVLFFAASFVLPQVVHAQNEAVFPFAGNCRRILFLGNSITYGGEYVTDIETYFLIHYPKQSLEWINEGLPSETVSGLSEEGHADGRFPRPDLHERLARVLTLTKPDVVFACYGMNDGIYMPFDETRFKAYRDGMRWLHDQLEQIGAKRIIFLTPPVHDDKTLGTKGYNLVLDRYAQWLLQQRDSLKWEVADIHFPMTKYLEDQRALDPSFKLADDGVHPGALGHWLMAKAVLLYLGMPVADAKEFGSTISNAANGKEIYSMVSRRQQIMKDTWLTTAGHKRPEMPVGMPLQQARAQYDSIEQQIRILLR